MQDDTNNNVDRHKLAILEIATFLANNRATNVVSLIAGLQAEIENGNMSAASPNEITKAEFRSALRSPDLTITVVSDDVTHAMRSAIWSALSSGSPASLLLGGCYVEFVADDDGDTGDRVGGP